MILTNPQEGCLFAMFTLLATEEEPKLRVFNQLGKDRATV